MARRGQDEDFAEAAAEHAIIEKNLAQIQETAATQKKAELKVYGIDSAGASLWKKFTIGFNAASAAIGGDGTVYIGSFDGNLYALSVPGSSINLEIVRVNPSNGQRTLVWRAQDAGFAQCASGDPARMGVQVHGSGFAVDAMGRFYLGFTNTSPYGEGVGVVRIDANGMGCSFVTRSGALSLNAYFGQDVGTGFAFDRGRYQGFDLRNGKLYAIQHAFLTLVEVDLATGNRTRISSASTSSILGDGPTGAAGMGQRWVVYDSTRDLYWASGTFSRRMMIAVDPATGERTEAFCQSVNPARPWRDLCLGGALIAGYQNEGGMWVDTNGDLIVVHENFSLVRANLSDGNSIRISL